MTSSHTGFMTPKGVLVGTDNIAPVYEPDSVWKTWSMDEIFKGKEGYGKYVPKVGDHVIDLTTLVKYEVVSIDYTTYVPELRELKIPVVKTLEDEDPLLNSSRKIRRETYRVYLDTSVTPHILSVDSRFTVNGTMLHHAEIFLGPLMNKSAKPISALFDQYGTFVGTTIPLELVFASGTNHAVKIIPPCHTLMDLPNGEYVVVYVYDDNGNVCCVEEMSIELTNVVRQVDASLKYITDISLESPYISKSDLGVLRYPLNAPIRGLNLFGVVHYSDGSQKRLPVDGTKFSVLGLRDYIATTPSYAFEFTLKYSLSPNETGLGAIKVSTGKETFIPKKYRGITLEPNDSYSVKLYGYPVWIDSLNGYRLEWWLCNLERSFAKRVTQYVKYNSNRVPFNGLLYGINQRLSVSIDLKEVSVTNLSYTHTQVIDVMLLREGQSRQVANPLWQIGFEINQFPYYGNDGLFAKVIRKATDDATLSLGNDLTTFEEWLEKVYYAIKPLYDVNHEVKAILPTHFRVITDSRETEFTIDQWNQSLDIQDNIDYIDNVYLVFIHRSNDTDLYLGVSCLPVQYEFSLIV